MQTKEQKKKVIEGLKDKISKYKSMVFVAINGLKAADIYDLRNKLKAEDCKIIVAKKTLFNIAFKEKKVPFEKEKMKGEVALIFGFKDEISAPRIAHQFALKHENLKFLGGVLEDKFIGVEEVIFLAKLPLKQELLARFLQSISAPASNFASVLQGNIKGLLIILTKINK